MQQPDTGFTWGIYADATFAGLASLIPVPLLDLAFEQFFRRRMPGAIARQRGRPLAPAVLRILNRWHFSWASCLLFPLWLVLKLLQRLSKKILYFLAVKEAVDNLSYYWRRAFLIDTMLLAGHLQQTTSARLADRAMAQTLEHARFSPIQQLAWQVSRQAQHVLRTLWRIVRSGREDTMIAEERAAMETAWRQFDAHLRDLAATYQRNYQQLKAQEVNGEEAPAGTG